ncbi:MAG: AAA family ATPase [Bacteriovorax sp.]
MRVEKVNFTIGDSKTEITLFPNGEEVRSKNTFSILIGKNGTFKSSTLKVVADFYRKSRKTKDEIIGDVTSIDTPSKVIAISSTSGDKFALSQQTVFPSMKYQAISSDLRYFYFGPKSRSSFSNRFQVQQLMDAVAYGMSSQKTKATILHIFKDLELYPTLEFVFKKSDKLSKLSDKDARIKINEILEKKLEGNKSLQKRLEKISKDIFSQKNGIHFFWDLKTEENYSDMLTLINILLGKQQLQFVDVKLSKLDLTSFGINQLSSGEASLLLKFLSLASVVEDNSLILFDEPENSLHPNWQITFLDQFKKVLSSLEGCHVIIATHSPHILSDFKNEDGCVVELSRDKNKIIGTPIDFEIYGWSVEKILIDIFGIATTRNHYFEMRLRRLLKEIGSTNPSSDEVSSLIHELEGFAKDRDDPLKNILEEARKTIQL